MKFEYQNTALAYSVLKELEESGVREYCVCPGARNAPWVALLSENPRQFRTYFFYEERSAAFFALGRIRRTGRPVGVITTSGTAVGELLPAAMEGYYSCLPLILLTADRPSRFRGSGAPQVAEQVGLFGVYSSQCLDIEGEIFPKFSFPLDRPVHINVCFEEPLLAPPGFLKWENLEKNPEFDLRLKRGRVEKHLPEGNSKSDVFAAFDTFFEKSRRPVCIIGSLSCHFGESQEIYQSLVKLLLDWGAPVYIEGLSGLREEPRLANLQIYSADSWIEKTSQADWSIDGVIRVGAVPTLRAWRDLETRLSHLPVLSLSAQPFSGLGRPSQLLSGCLLELCEALSERISRNQSQIKADPSDNPGQRRFLDFEYQRETFLQTLLKSEPDSEPGMIAALSRIIPGGSFIYLGNSSPVREWDLAATRENRNFEVCASRGLNGIDGQVSTFLGLARSERQNWAVLGDLTALYDLPGPWILPQMPEVSITLVVVNNQGGQIFSRMFPYQEFQNPHQLRFEAWAELWGLDYQVWTCAADIANEAFSEKRGNRIIELRPDLEATQRFWRKYKALSAPSV